MFDKSKEMTIRLDGPFGTPTQNYDDYKNLIFICTGIGATPFSSVIRDVIY